MSLTFNIIWAVLLVALVVVEIMDFHAIIFWILAASLIGFGIFMIL